MESSCFSLAIVSLFVSFFWFLSPALKEETNPSASTMLGGLFDSLSQNSGEIESLGRFAVEQHNKKENALLEFGRVVKAQEQVVAGSLHHLTIEVVAGGKKMLYEAKVWVKPWMNFKELQDFKPAGDVPSITPADLGVKSDPVGVGWQTVSVEDPWVMLAANHAVESIQKKSNTLLPYKLHEILDAKAEVTEGSVQMEMVVKVMRGEKGEKYKVGVHKNVEGVHSLNRVELDLS